MGLKKYKVGDKVYFTFLGESLKGTVEEIRKEKPHISKYGIKYWVFDGKHRYPTSYENMKGIVNEK